MKLKIFTLLLLSSILFLGSCKKEKEEDVMNTTADVQVALNQANEQRSCRTTENLEDELLKDPTLKTRMAEMEVAIQEKISQRSHHGATITIPVVVHILYNTTAQNISDAQVLSQIDILNRDFSRTNSDAANTPAAFQAVAGHTDIQFALAQRDPFGNPTTGIIRKFTTNTSWSSNGAVKLSSMGGDDAWPCASYLNIWVCNLSGSLGYATYPGGNPIADGAVIRHAAFGNTGTVVPPYHLGRTATHEVAHWLYLYHIWGDATCGNDFIQDSPTQQAANFGCPAFPHVSCSNGPSGDMFMNYMDYSNDNCMNMFTQGQAARMLATLQTVRSTITTSLGAVPPAGAACPVPTGLAASSIATTSAVFSWSSANAVSYNVRYKITSGNVWTNTSTTTTSLTASSLVTSSTYEFQVQSVCSANISPFSASTTFTTLSPPSCTVPAGLVVTNIQYTTATLDWTTSTQVSRFNVRYKPTLSSTWTDLSANISNLNVTNLAGLTWYEYQVQSVCTDGNSPFSASATFFTSDPACAIPSGLSSFSIASTSASIRWASTGASSYKVRYKATTSANWIDTATSGLRIGLQGLATSTSYEFQVQSVCPASTSSYSASTIFTTSAAAAPCDMPFGLFCSSVSTSGALIRWTGTGASGYNVRYKPSGSVNWSSTFASGTSFSLTGLAADTDYEFEVQSVCPGGSISAYSSSSFFTTMDPVIACNSPGSLSAPTIGSTKTTVSWSTTGAGTYNIRYKPTTAGNWTTVSTNSTLYTLMGLTPNTVYEFQVQSDCQGNSSVYSTSSIFTTL